VHTYIGIYFQTQSSILLNSKKMSQWNRKSSNTADITIYGYRKSGTLSMKIRLDDNNNIMIIDNDGPNGSLQHDLP